MQREDGEATVLALRTGVTCRRACVLLGLRYSGRCPRCRLMHIARSPAVGRLCAGTKDSSKQARCSSTQSNSKFRWVYNGKPDQFAAFAAPRVHRASSNFHRGIHTATSKMDLDAVGPGPQLPLLPLSLLGSLAAAWRFTSG